MRKEREVKREFRKKRERVQKSFFFFETEREYVGECKRREIERLKKKVLVQKNDLRV